MHPFIPYYISLYSRSFDFSYLQLEIGSADLEQQLVKVSNTESLGREHAPGAGIKFLNIL